MKRWVTICIAVIVSLAVASYAGEKKDQGDFWSKIKDKIESITPKKKTTVTTAVGGVRGVQEGSATALYWKGKEIDNEVAADELDKFKKALECAINGNKKESLRLFDEFLARYPNSPLRKDAAKAVKNLKAGK